MSDESSRDTVVFSITEQEWPEVKESQDHKIENLVFHNRSGNTMLYIKFEILNIEKFTDFQKLYDHMVAVRVPGFEFNDETDDKDSGEATQKEMELISKKKIKQGKRYRDFIPNYANAFLERYLRFDNNKSGPLGILDLYSILNYLECGFEVDLDNLEKLNDRSGLVEFSTSNYPYGGMERFLMVLKAFDLIPAECYNGFTVYKFDWTSSFEHNAIELPRRSFNKNQNGDSI